MPRPSRSLLLSTAGVAALVAVLVVAGRLTSGSLRAPATTTTLPALVTHPTSTAPSPVMARIRFRQPVDRVAVGPDAVWVAHGCAISRVDPRTNRVVAKVAGIRPRPDGCSVLGIRVGAGALWASLWGQGLARIDPVANRVVATVAIDDITASPALTPDGVWVLCCGAITPRPGAWLARIDPATNRMVARVRLGGLPEAVAAGPSGVWAAAPGGPVWRVDPATNRVVARIGISDRPGGRGVNVLVGREAVWVSDPASATVVRIDPRRNRVTGRDFAGGQAMVAAAGTVWATSETTLVPVGDPGRREVPLVDIPDLEGDLDTIGDLAAGAGALWVAAPAGLYRVDLRRLR
jgi:DNA-binding beta-propeller fold protein YncE